MSSGEDALMIREYVRLHQWRKYVKPVIEAACEVVQGGTVYLAGGAAEGRLTTLSYVDVIVVVPRRLEPYERVEVKLEILDKAF